MTSFPQPERQSFDCQRCGHCCRGRGGIVVSAGDLKRLCAFTRTTPEEFLNAWGEKRGGKLHIRAGEDAFCVFFTQDTGCAVHEAKPDICRAWPYFRGNLMDAWSFESSKDFCPGIPPSLSHAGFVRQGLAWLSEGHLAGTAGQDEANALQVSDLLESLAQNDKKR